MGRSIQQVDFAEWLDFLFDHSVTEPAWHWSTEVDEWNGSPAETLSHLTRTFRESGTALAKYSDAQLKQGFWYLADAGCSNIACSLDDRSAPEVARLEAIESIGDLFEHCFARRCSDHLSHLDEPGANSLNDICYMWWDVLPICGQPEDPARKRTDAAVLQILERTLQLDSEAWRESALHGLGHWQRHYPQEVERIIHHFIWSHRQIRAPLRNYAYAARHGDLL